MMIVFLAFLQEVRIQGFLISIPTTSSWSFLWAHAYSIILNSVRLWYPLEAITSIIIRKFQFSNSYHWVIVLACLWKSSGKDLLFLNDILFLLVKILPVDLLMFLNLCQHCTQIAVSCATAITRQKVNQMYGTYPTVHTSSYALLMLLFTQHVPVIAWTVTWVGKQMLSSRVLNCAVLFWLAF